MGDVWKPVAYASRFMSETERRYAQIENEALVVTWACDKFSVQNSSITYRHTYFDLDFN